MALTYLEGWKRMMQGDIDLEAGSVKALLIESAGAFLETEATVTIVLTGGDELDADSGYARQTLAAPAVSVAAGKSKFASSNVSFGPIDSADTAIAMLIYWESGGGDGTSIPLAYSDGPDEVFTDNNLKTLVYNCPATGWMNVGNS